MSHVAPLAEARYRAARKAWRRARRQGKEATKLAGALWAAVNAAAEFDDEWASDEPSAECLETREELSRAMDAVYALVRGAP